MLYSRSPLFNRLYEQINAMPVIDCHEHLIGPEERPPYKEPIASLIYGYMLSDLHSAAFGIRDSDVARLEDQDVSADEKWPLFENLWHATEHTAYAQVTKLVLKNVYGESELTREALDRVAEKLADQTEGDYFRTIDEAGIQVTKGCQSVRSLVRGLRFAIANNVVISWGMNSSSNWKQA